MAPEPAPGTGRDEDPVPYVPVPGRVRLAGVGMVTPDWMDDADWQRSCAAREDEECLPHEDAEWFSDPDCGAPPELADIPFEVLAAQVDADGAADAAVTARMIELGVCREGYAHRPGNDRVTGAGGGPYSASENHSMSSPAGHSASSLAAQARCQSASSSQSRVTTPTPASSTRPGTGTRGTGSSSRPVPGAGSGAMHHHPFGIMV